MDLMIDARTMGNRPSGIGLYLYSFLKEIAKEKDIKLYLISDVDVSEEMQDMKSRGAHVILYGKKVFRSAGVFGYFRFVRKMAVRYQPDLFMEPNNLMPLPMTGYKGKTVLVIHDIFPITEPDTYSKLYQLYFRFLIKRSIRRTDLILYNSDNSRQATEKYFPFAKKVKSLITYIIVDKKEDFSTSEMPVASNHPDNHFFLYLGNLAKRKGTDTLIIGYKKYILAGGKRRLYLAGGINEQELPSLIEKTNQEIKEKTKTEMITYLGYISNEEKQRYISNCDCFLFPSRAEGFGIPIIEVMNYYRPVIASDLDIFKEITGDAIRYYKRQPDFEQETAELAAAMLEFDKESPKSGEVDCKKYKAVIERYSAKALGKRMIQSLRELQ